MGLNVSLQALTQPGATGNQTISLAANFDPKVIILWGNGATAAGTAAHAQFCLGFGTYRASTVAQRFAAIDARDGATTGNVCREQNTNALFVLHIAAAPGSRDMEIGLVSMQTGATSQVVINWANLHTTASVKVNCLILGGSDITDALAISVAEANAANQDVTVATGFGQPDLLFSLMATGTADLTASENHVSFGFAKKGEAGRSLVHGSFDGNTLMGVIQAQRSNVFLQDTYLSSSGVDTPGTDMVCTLDTTTANWPTDGFRVLYSTPSTSGVDSFYVLAIKGTLKATTGNGVAPVTGSLPVVQNLDHGAAPKLGFLFGWNRTATTSSDNTGTDLGAFFVGAGDGTIELCAGITDDDAAGTSIAKKFWSNAKVVQNYNVTPALQSEADGLISGNNFQLSWNDIDTVAREYQWLTLGDGGTTITAVAIASSEAMGVPGAKQTATPTGIASSEAIGVPLSKLKVVAAGIASLESPGNPLALLKVVTTSIASSEAIGVPGAKQIATPTGIASSEAIGSATVTFRLAAVGIASSEAMGSPGVKATAVTVGIASSQALGNPTTKLTVAPLGIASNEAIGAPLTKLSAVATGIASQTAIGVPTVRPTVAPVGIASNEAIGVPGIRAVLKPTGIASSEAMGSPTAIITGGPLLPASIPSQEAIGSPSVKETVVTQGIASQQAIGSPGIKQTATSQGIASQEAIGLPALLLGVRPASVSSQEAFGILVLKPTLSAVGISSGEAFGSAGINVIINAVGIVSIEALGDPLIIIGAVAGMPTMQLGKSLSGDILKERQATSTLQKRPVKSTLVTTKIKTNPKL